MQYTFNELIAMAEREAGSADAPTRPTIVKELLHYCILDALSRSHLQERVSFMGGTALRLVYNGDRYSEDLDFVCGSDAREPFDLAGMEKVLADSVGAMGLTMSVKSTTDGDEREFAEGNVAVKRWKFKINVPGFAAAQVINFEVCNVSSYDSSPMLISPRYSFLSDVYSDIALNVHSEGEIYADKVVALIGRSHVKNRDLWDLVWLRNRGHEVNWDWVERKAGEYRLADIPDRIERARERLQAADAHDKFVAEMVRFVKPGTARVLTNPDFSRRYLENALRILNEAEPRLVQSPSMRP